jgi:hypothetical protein
MSSSSRRIRESRKEQPDVPSASPSHTVFLEVNAAYNRDGLPLPGPNGPNGRRVLNIEMLMNHAFYWEWLNERETEEVLMELYMVRTRRMQ